MENKEYSFTNEDLVYVVGYSNLPENSVAGALYKNVALSLIINTKTDIIIDGTINMANQLSIQFIMSQMIGKNVLTEYQQIIDSLSRYQGPAQKSIVVALKAVKERYKSYKKVFM